MATLHSITGAPKEIEEMPPTLVDTSTWMSRVCFAVQRRCPTFKKKRVPAAAATAILVTPFPRAVEPPPLAI